MKRLTPLAIFLLFGLLVACGTQMPSVEYEEVSKDKPDLEGLVKFALPKTIFVLNYKDPKSKDTVEMTAVPAEWEPRLFQIRPSDPWLRKSSFKWTKRENTNLLQQVGSEVEDNRVKTIQTIGTTLATIVSSGVLFDAAFDIEGITAPKAPKETDSLKLPLAIDTAPFLTNYKTPNTPISDKVSDGTDPKKGGEVAFTIKFGPLPPDAMALSDYLSSTEGKRQNALFTSACRTATIIFTGESPLKGQKYTSTVADPNFVQTVAFPPNGTITLHSVCGANVMSEKAAISTTAEVINALLAQAKSLSETWKTEKAKEEAANKTK